jgi:hypothetical protein
MKALRRPNARGSNLQTQILHQEDGLIESHGFLQTIPLLDESKDILSVNDPTRIGNSPLLLDSMKAASAMERKEIQFDENRIPKLGSFLFFVFFTMGGLNYLINDPSDNVQIFARKELNYTAFDLNATDLVESNIISKPNLDLNGNPVRLPRQVTNLADITSPYNPKQEVALFWHIPRSGGTTLKDLAAFCYDLTQASEVGVFIGAPATDKASLKMVVDVETGSKFLNIDTTSLEGLEQAKDLEVASFQGLDLVSTPYLYHAADGLFNVLNRGRMLTIFRHPVERAVSMFYFWRERPEYTGESNLELFAKSSMVENNWMTRFLSNKMAGELTLEDEAIAKEILRTKALIGLLERKHESLRRFRLYFGWNVVDEECDEKLLNWGWSGNNHYSSVQEGSEVWSLLMEQNTFDMRLYDYAKILFEEQARLFDRQ